MAFPVFYLCGNRQHYDPGEQHGCRDQVGQGVQTLGSSQLHRQLPGSCVEAHLQAEGRHQQHHAPLTETGEGQNTFVPRGGQEGGEVFTPEASPAGVRVRLAHLVVCHPQKRDGGVKSVGQSAVMVPFSWRGGGLGQTLAGRV